MSNERSDGTNVDELSIIAHRGFCGFYPENTLGAFEAASGAGNDGLGHQPADMIELDIRPCADGTIVVFHDAQLDRLTPRDGFVRELPSEELLQTEVLDSGQTIPTLEQALDAIPPSVDVLIELKNPGNAKLQRGRKVADNGLAEQKDHWRPFTRRVLEIVSQHKHEFVISSFAEAAIATVRELDASVPISFIFGGDGGSLDDRYAIVREHDCEWVQPGRFATHGLERGGPPNEDVIATLRSEGRTVVAPTSQTWIQLRDFRRAGADAIIVDYPLPQRF